MPTPDFTIANLEELITLLSEGGKMATIVEYSRSKPPLNAYPRRIISPPHPSPCCRTEMHRIGKVEQERGWSFFYKRCRICGYTVRHFLPMSEERYLGKWWGLLYGLTALDVA